MANAAGIGFRCTLAGMLLFAGCHSACFQTANIRDGTDATIGMTKVDAADNPDISDYSVFIKGEVGREARKTRFGYSLGITFVAPVRNRYRSAFTSADPDAEVFPNEWAGVLPEFKLQIPRVLPVDVALDFRLMGYLPERVALLSSYRVASILTLYGSWSYSVAIAPQLCLGARVNASERLSVLMEYSAWQSDHDYPDDFSGPALRRPHSIGIALCHHWPKSPKNYDSRRFTKGSPWGRSSKIAPRCREAQFLSSDPMVRLDFGFMSGAHYNIITRSGIAAMQWQDSASLQQQTKGYDDESVSDCAAG